MEIGEYIRTPYGIRKIIDIKKDDGYGKPRVKVIELDNFLDTFYKYSYTFYTDEKVVKEAKHSFNIIDLIEKFDLVNGHLVICKMYENEKDIPTIVKCVGDYYFKEEDIKSIVTKEQFESMKYKIGSE